MLPFLRFALKLIMLIMLYPLRLFPIKKNRVLLLNNILNFDAKYSCNPKYLAEYMLLHYPNRFQIIYPLGKDVDGSAIQKKGIVVVKLGSLKYYYYALTSKFFVTTSGAISYMPFRKEQIVINTWHGGGAYKKMGLDTTDNFFYRLDCKLTEAKTTYFLSSNSYFTDIIASSLLIDRKKVLEIGMPRNDIFFTDYLDISEAVKKQYHIEPDTHIVLYAPTYRTSGENSFLSHKLGPYEIDADAVVKSLEKRFGGKWVFAIRLHPSVETLLSDLPNNIINMSSYNDIQHLMCAADVLINDYSSTMWDFVQTRKPCFIFAKDIAEYESNLGLYTKPSSWPFPLAETNNALVNNIENFNLEKYISDVKYYFEWMHNFEDGHCCENLCKIMEKYME